MCARESSLNLISRCAIVFIALTLLGGCATRESLDLPDLGDWDNRRYFLEQLDEWEFKGRIGVVTGDDGFNASLRWSQECASLGIR